MPTIAKAYEASAIQPAGVKVPENAWEATSSDKLNTRAKGMLSVGIGRYAPFDAQHSVSSQVGIIRIDDRQQSWQIAGVAMQGKLVDENALHRAIATVDIGR